jgi:hypothetical protein
MKTGLGNSPVWTRRSEATVKNCSFSGSSVGTSRKRSAATSAVRVILEEGEWKLANSVIGYTVTAVVWTISSALRSSSFNPGPWVSRLSPHSLPLPLMAQFLILDQTRSMERSDKEGKSLSTSAIVLTFNHSLKKKKRCHTWIVALCKVCLKNVRKSVVRIEHFEAQISGGKMSELEFPPHSIHTARIRTIPLILYVEMIVVYSERYLEYINTLCCRMHVILNIQGAVGILTTVI